MIAPNTLLIPKQGMEFECLIYVGTLKAMVAKLPNGQIKLVGKDEVKGDKSQKDTDWFDPLFNGWAKTFVPSKIYCSLTFKQRWKAGILYSCTSRRKIS